MVLLYKFPSGNQVDGLPLVAIHEAHSVIQSILLSSTSKMLQAYIECDPPNGENYAIGQFFSYIVLGRSRVRMMQSFCTVPAVPQTQLLLCAVSKPAKHIFLSTAGLPFEMKR